MSDEEPNDSAKKPKPGRYLLYSSIAVFAVLAVNIVVGKIAVLNGATETVGLGDVGEFIALFIAMVLFIAACLARERHSENQSHSSS